MAAVIQLSSASSNMEGYLNGWTSGYSSTYGAFWDEGNGLVTNPLSTTVYEQWGNGTSGGNGIYIEGEFQYSRGNLTGTVDSISASSTRTSRRIDDAFMVLPGGTDRRCREGARACVLASWRWLDPPRRTTRSDCRSDHIVPAWSA